MNTRKGRVTPAIDTAFEFDWDLIRSFLAVMDAGSLLGASRLRSAAQPTIGRHIESLEKQLGKVLFERTGRGLKPTDDARLIASHARRMQSEADALGRAIVGSTGTEGGLVRIAASRVVAIHVLPDQILKIQQRLPHIDIAIVASDQTSNLLRRHADIALRHMRPEQSSLIARKLGESPIQPCASIRYLERHGTPNTIQDLLGHHLIGADRERAFLNAFDQVADAHNFPRDSVRFVIRSDDFATRFAAVRAGLGIGFSPSHAIDRCSDVVALPVNLPLPVLPLWLVVHREIRTTPRIRQVYDELVKLMGP